MANRTSGDENFLNECSALGGWEIFHRCIDLALGMDIVIDGIVIHDFERLVHHNSHHVGFVYAARLRQFDGIRRGSSSVRRQAVFDPDKRRAKCAIWLTTTVWALVGPLCSRSQDGFDDISITA